MTMGISVKDGSELVAGDNRVRGRHDLAPRVMAISSGKGGVGKTNCVINLAIAFARMDKKVLILDADLGLGNVDVLLGLDPEYNIGHLLRGEKTIEEVMVKGPSGIMIIPASGGEQEFTRLAAHERHALSSYIEGLQAGVDVMLIDTGSGISDDVLFFNMAAQEIIIVVSPDPASAADAHSLMAALLRKHGERKFKLLVNTVRSKNEGFEVYKRVLLGVERGPSPLKGLNVSIDYIGSVLKDDSVGKAAGQRKAVVDAFPGSKASRCYLEAARTLDEMPVSKDLKGGLQFMWQRMLSANCNS